MVRKIRVYVEGGNTGEQKKRMRIAFAQFLHKASGNNQINVVASGDRGQTYKDFCRENKQNQEDLVLLLVDAEGPVENLPWDHLQKQDNWLRPKDVQHDQCHLMVQVMESWFIADLETLENYYGPDFRPNAMPKNPDVEQIPKKDIESSLRDAPKKTSKGEYHKMKHGPDILDRLNPEQVRRASQHFERLLQRLKQ